MDIFVFDIDDTIVLHTREVNDYYTQNSNTTLKNILSDFKNIKYYVYTNGTFNHGKAIIDNLNLNVEMIFARDIIQFMKPDNRSFKIVNRIIRKDIWDINKSVNRIIFFDDLKENLETAKKFGWTTVLINPELKEKEKYIDYIFPNIYESIIYFKMSL